MSKTHDDYLSILKLVFKSWIPQRYQPATVASSRVKSNLKSVISKIYTNLQVFVQKTEQNKYLKKY